MNQTRTPLEYETVPASKVMDRLREGWLPVSPFVSMVRPEYQDDEMRAIAAAAKGLGQE